MRIRILVTVGVLVARSTLTAQERAPDSASIAGVADLLARFDASASAAGKLHASARAALFADDAIFINAFGGRQDGRPTIDSTWARLYRSTAFDSSRIELLERRQRWLGSGLVLVDHIECLTGQRGPNSGRTLPPRTTHITILLRQERTSEWRIAYYRAGDVRELARSPSVCAIRRTDSMPARPNER